MRGLRPISHSFNGGWQPLRQGRGLQEGRNQLASAPAAHVPRQAWRKTGSILEATPVRMGNARQIENLLIMSSAARGCPAREIAPRCVRVSYL